MRNTKNIKRKLLISVAIFFVAHSVCGPARGQTCPTGNSCVSPDAIVYYASPNCSTTHSVAQTYCYPVAFDTHVVTDATFVSGSTTVQIGTTDPPFACPGGSFPCSTSGAGSDVGKSVVGTYNCLPGNPMQCQNEFTSANARIVSVTDSTHAVISQSAVAGSGSGSGGTSTGSNFSWGTDDTTHLQTLASAVLTAASSQPVSVELPCGATTISGPFLRRGLTSITARAFPIGLSGCPAEASTIVMRPDTTCSSLAQAPGCFFSDNYLGGISYTQIGMGDRVSNVFITGLGFDNFVGTTFANDQAVVYVAGYSELDNVWVNGFAWNQSATPSNVTYGIQTYYADAIFTRGGGILVNSGSWLGGDWACAFGGGTYTPTVVYGGYCGGTEFAALTLTGSTGSTVELNGMVLVNGDYSSGQLYQCSALYAPGSSPSSGLAAFTGTFIDHGSLIYGGTYVYSGTLNLNNDVLSNMNFGPACTQTRSLYLNGGSVYAQNANFTPVLHSGADAIDIISGSFFDLGGNLLLPASVATGSNVFGSASITGTALTVGGVSLTSGWGSSASVINVTPNSDSRKGQFSVMLGGTGQTSGPVATLTFPTAFMVAPSQCTIIQTGGTFTLTNPVVGAPSTTSVTFTWSGTPGTSGTYRFAYQCN